MNNISLDTTSFSEQLGIYDFFNVLLSGTIFVFGLCSISSNVEKFLWNNMTVQKWIGIVLIIYVIGMILQELGSKADRYCFKIYKSMNRSILKGKIDNGYKEEAKNAIVKNPILLERYRKIADKLTFEFITDKDNEKFENDYISGFVFSVCQYYVSIKGKDKKIEKLRALFAMSKTLIICFVLLAICALLSIAFFSDTCSVLPYATTAGCNICSGKVLLAFIFSIIAFLFYLRAKRTMKNFLLILLGTYDAIIRAEEKELKLAKNI